MNLLFESFITFWQANILIRFLVSFFGVKNETGRTRVVCFGTFIFAITVMLFNMATYYEGIAVFIYILELIILAKIFLRGRLFSKIIVSFSMLVVVSLVTTLVMKMIAVIGNLNLTQIYSQMSIYRACGIVLIQIVLEFIALIVGKKFGESKVYFQKREWTIILLNITCSLFIILTLNFLEFQLVSKEGRYLVLILIFLVTIMNMILFVLMSRLSESNIKIRENEAIQLKYNYYDELVSKISLQYAELIQIRHDIKHLGQTMNVLIRRKEYDSLQSLFEEWSRQICFHEHTINTGNQYVDALLNTKLNYAKSIGIETRCSIITDFEGIDNTDMINLLGNLLDNAIEANEMENPERSLELCIAGDKYSISIQVKNTVFDNALKRIVRSETNKNNKKEHGYGLKIIRRIVSKYNGNIFYDEQNNIVYSDIVLFRA